MTPFFWFAIAALLGCQRQPDFSLDEELTVRGGCGDAYFFAKSPADEAVLVIEAPEIVAQAWEAGDSYSNAFNVSENAIGVFFQVGTNVGAPVCNDVIDGEIVVDQQYIGIGGVVRTFVTPGDTEPAAQGEAILENVQLLREDGSGDPIDVPSLTITAQLGFMPG